MNRQRRCAAAGMIALTIALTGCGSAGFDPDRSGVYLKKDGSVVSAEIESFDNSAFEEERYQEEELQSFVETEVSEYNQTACGTAGFDKKTDGLAVTLESLSVGSGMAKLVLNYATAEDYLEFNNGSDELTELTIVSAPTAVSSGISLEGMVDAEGNAVDTTAMASNEKYYVAVAAGDTQVTVQGKIAAVSGSVTVQDKDKVLIAGGEQAVILFK